MQLLCREEVSRLVGQLNSLPNPKFLNLTSLEKHNFSLLFIVIVIVISEFADSEHVRDKTHNTTTTQHNTTQNSKYMYKHMLFLFNDNPTPFFFQTYYVSPAALANNLLCASTP